MAAVDLTKKALVSTLKVLLEFKRLDKLTVREVCAATGVSTSTFYYHFSDIYALAEWAIEQDAAAVLRDKRHAESWKQGFIQLLEQIRGNRALIMNVYHSMSRERVEFFLLPLAHDLINGMVIENVEAAGLKAEDLAFLSDFFKYGFVGITLDWIGEGMTEEPRILIEKLSFIMEGQIERAIERAIERVRSYQSELDTQ